MNDIKWQEYTNAGNYFFDQKQHCCACSNYNKALNEAELLLMNSYDISEEIPVIPVLLISYQNVFSVYDQVENTEQLRCYLSKATKALIGILQSPEFPLKVQQDCRENIFKLYHTISDYCQKQPILVAEGALLLKNITTTIMTYTKNHQEKGSQ